MPPLPTTNNPWTQSPSHSGLVSVGPHSLLPRASGPPREPSAPAIIIEAGLGGTSSEWVSVSRLIAKFARVYSYDRAGFGKSKPLSSSGLPLTATKRCEELTILLEVAGIDPPWILVGHSYGGVLVREYLLMHGKEKVVGMCIVDSAITRMKLPDSWPSLLRNERYEVIVGLERERVLSDEEWDAVKSDGEGNEDTVAQEEKEMFESTRLINEKMEKGRQVLGDGRLSVVFCDESVDFGKILSFAEEKGFGSEEARQALRTRLVDMSEIDEKGQRAHLRMSNRSRFVTAEGVARTHNVQFVRPELVAEEVRWVLKGIEV
jgi:pimeloyl-ACP methyl ester carboxylesterase